MKNLTWLYPTQTEFHLWLRVWDLALLKIRSWTSAFLSLIHRNGLLICWSSTSGSVLVLFSKYAPRSKEVSGFIQVIISSHLLWLVSDMLVIVCVLIYINDFTCWQYDLVIPLSVIGFQVSTCLFGCFFSDFSMFGFFFPFILVIIFRFVQVIFIFANFVHFRSSLRLQQIFSCRARAMYKNK